MSEASACSARVASVRGADGECGREGRWRGCRPPRPRRREQRSGPCRGLRLPSRSPRGRAAPPPAPSLSPPPGRARPAPHPRPAARAAAAAMSAQAQMRAMLDQLMGTSRDGKSGPGPWVGEGRPARAGARGRTWARAGLGKGRPDRDHEVPGSRPDQSGPGGRARGVVTERIGGNCCQWGEAGPEAERRVCAVAVDLAGPGEPASSRGLPRGLGPQLRRRPREARPVDGASDPNHVCCGGSVWPHFVGEIVTACSVETTILLDDVPEALCSACRPSSRVPRREPS